MIFFLGGGGRKHLELELGSLESFYADLQNETKLDASNCQHAVQKGLR